MNISSDEVKEIIKNAMRKQGYLGEDEFIDGLVINPLVRDGRQLGITMTYTAGISGSLPLELGMDANTSIELSLLAKYIKLRDHFSKLVRSFMNSKPEHGVRAIMTFVPYIGGETKNAEFKVHIDASVPEGNVLIHPSDYFKVMRGEPVNVG